MTGVAFWQQFYILDNEKLNRVQLIMRKIIAAFNMTLDGFCDHTAVDPDDEILEYYSDLLRSADTILYGRTTYHLMEYWQSLAKNPSGNKPMDEFAQVIDHISKIVFSHTLKNVDWNNARLAKYGLKEEVLARRRQTGNPILIGSRSLIISLMELNLIDEYRFCIFPVIVGEGLPFFNCIRNKITLKLVKTKSFGCGAVALYYEPIKNYSGKLQTT